MHLLSVRSEVSLIVDDNRTCPLPDLDDPTEICHAYGDDYRCGAGHAVAPDEWIPLRESARETLARLATSSPIVSEDS